MFDTKEIIQKEIYDLEKCILKKFAEILLIKDFEQLNGEELANTIIDTLVDDENPTYKTNNRLNNIRKELKSIIVEHGKRLQKNEMQFEKELIAIKDKFKEKEEALLYKYDRDLLSFISNLENYTPIIK
jgi:hypothetical protein